MRTISNPGMFRVIMQEAPGAPWIPAVRGTINQTGTSDEEASTADTWEAAFELLETLLELTELDEGGYPRFKIEA